MTKQIKELNPVFSLTISSEIKSRLPATSSVVGVFGALFLIQPDLANSGGSFAIPERSKNLKNWQDKAEWAKKLGWLLRECVWELQSTCNINYLEADTIVRPIQSACWLITGQANGFDPFADEDRTKIVLQQASESWARLIDLLRDLPVTNIDSQMPKDVEKRLKDVGTGPQPMRLIRKLWFYKEIDIDDLAQHI